MTEQQGLFGAETDEEAVSKAAVRRHFMGLGKAVEEFRAGVVSLASRQRYVYDIGMRWPSAERANYMCIIKALSPEGPQISFVSGGDWMNTWLEAGRLMRAGALTWHQDTYPPDGWEERLGWFHSRA